ncbi:MAG: hypothetical protein M9921_03580 [Fimbriimonadaceae bacterium]|nr:hypothetical protein [Fimbriimonadaceae bacterium]
MNATKAKEFFSAYYEGSIDAGLKQSFERRLAADADLQAEYQAFARAMAELDAIREIEIAIPDDLHERIQARLDKHVFDQKRSSQPALLSWWRPLAIAAVGALAIFGAVQSLTNKGGGLMTGDVLSPKPAEVPLRVESIDGVPTLFYRPAEKHTLIVRNVSDGTERERLEVDGRLLRSELRNSGASASLVSIDVGDGTVPMMVAIPGRQPTSHATGQGTIREFVLALADHYRTPVTLQTGSPDRTVVWDFTSTDPLADAAKALKDTRFSVEQRYSGVLTIQEHE